MAKYTKRKDGRYSTQILVGYQDNGKRKVKTLYGRTVRELEKKEASFRNKLNNDLLLLNENLTVGEWADVWISTFKPSIAYNTRTRYEGIIANYIKPMLGSMKVSQVKLYNIQSMMNELSKTLASATVQKIKHALHQMFAQAVRLQYMHRNPVDGVETPALRQKDRAIIPEKDILRMTQFCRTYEHGALIMTLLYTGLRRGELLALTKADVDLENSIITVNKAVEFVGDMPNIKEPKTPRSNRRVPILDALLPSLIVLINDKEDTAPLFTNADGELHTKSSIECLFRDFNKKYNAYINLNKSEDEQETVHFTMHQFRHTFCTLLYRAGIDVKATQEMLGHSSVNVTLGIYTHLDNKLRQFNTDKINEFISSQSKVSQTAI